MEAYTFTNTREIRLHPKDRGEVFLSTPFLHPGDKVAPKYRKDLFFIILNDRTPTLDGWRYEAAGYSNGMLLPIRVDPNCELVVMGAHLYSDTWADWGPERKVQEMGEILTPQQGLQLAINTLAEFEDEYSDVRPIIEKLEKTLTITK